MQTEGHASITFLRLCVRKKTRSCKQKVMPAWPFFFCASEEKLVLANRKSFQHDLSSFALVEENLKFYGFPKISYGFLMISYGCFKIFYRFLRFPMDFIRFLMDFLRFPMDFLRFPMDFQRFPMDFLGFPKIS